jgi:type IV secretory pathway VirB3-like protein
MARLLLPKKSLVNEMATLQKFSTPVILALTRRATLCGLPYNAFITLLIGGCVAFIWVDSMTVVIALLLTSYTYFSVLCSKDMWALEIFFMRLQLGVCPLAIKKYFGKRCYYPG